MAVSTLGELTTFTNPAELLRIVATNGTDTIDVGALASGYASIEIEGDDTVNWNASITFATDRYLAVDNVDTIHIGAGAELAFSGTGSAALLASRSIVMNGGSRIQTVEVARLRELIETTAEHGFPNVIAMSGNRNGIPDDVGIENAVEALKQVAGLAEQKKVCVCIEYLNSRVDHAGYMFDHMAWGVEVCKRVGSPYVKILYDIYHAQIMEGDIIRTIRTHKDWIGHYHTGGNPGRNEIDETQELYYPAIMRAIVETGFTGYVAHEFVPKRDPLTSLAQAAKICDV